MIIQARSAGVITGAKSLHTARSLRPRSLPLIGLLTLTIAATAQAPAKWQKGPFKFVPHRIDKFRSEACAVADFNDDGKPDILAGENLYLAPDWKKVKVRTIKGTVDDAGKGYRWDFANIP